MAVYEYECKACGAVFEVEQRISDPALDSCRECGGKVERLISRCSFVLKGDGWYVSDHPSRERKKAIAKEKPSGDSASKGASSDKSSGSATQPSAAT